LTAEEVEGQNLYGLDIGLPVAKLKSQLRTVLSGKSSREEAVLEATNRRGRQFHCQVTMLRLGPSGDDGAAGAVMMMETVGA
jgi:hypothetical protein